MVDSMGPDRPAQEAERDRENESRNGDPVIAASAARAGAPVRAGQLKSVPELIEYAFSLQGKQVRVPQRVLKELAQTTAAELLEDENVSERLAELISSDPLLTVPPRLLVGLEEADATTLFKLRMARLLRVALRRHPLFAQSDDSGGADEPDAAGSDRIDTDALAGRIRLRTSEVTAAELGIASGALKRTDRDRLRVNAITTVALIASTLEQWNLDLLVEYLDRYLWRDAIAKPRALPSRVSIIESSVPEALGHVANVFGDRAERANRKTEAAVRDAAEAEARAKNLLARSVAADTESERLRLVVDGQRSEIATLQSHIETLQGQIDAERRERVIDQSHHIDDYEVLRTRIVRSLRKQVDLLEDGLHAARNQSYSVTEEFIERALESLSRELRQLNNGGA